MSQSFNNATFTGNLGKDAERRQVGDQTVCNFSIAVNGRNDSVMWVECALWGKRAEAGGVTEYLTKGKSVLVSGPVELDSYDGKPKLKLRVNELQLLGGGSDKADGKKTETKKSNPSEENPFA